MINFISNYASIIFSKFGLTIFKKSIIFLFLLCSFLNFAIGQNTSYNLNSIPITGSNNIAMGFQALLLNTTGRDNTAIGFKSLSQNTTGYSNVSIGSNSLISSVSGRFNVSIGTGSMSTTLGSTGCTSIGVNSLIKGGYFNTSIGFGSLNSTTGFYNTGSGGSVLNSNTTGNSNTGFGYLTLLTNTVGDNNTAVGAYADVALGNLTNATAIGNGAIVNASNTMQLGNSAVTEIYAGTSINATVIAGGLKITGGILGAGKVLTSDAAGVATWQTPIGGGGGFTGWGLTGNTGTINGTNFIGTTDNVAFNIRVNNSQAGRIDPISSNSFFGLNAGQANISGTSNSAFGEKALFQNTTGINNDAFGISSLENNTTGFFNTAIGAGSLYKNLTGTENVGFGQGTLQSNTSGNSNTATGRKSLWLNTVGSFNTGVGIYSLQWNQTGNYNTAIGWYAGSGSTLTALNNSTAIGSGAIVNASNKIRLGDAAVTIVEGSVLYTPSDMRFKSNISENEVVGLAFVNRLRPVVYNFETKKFTEFLTQNMLDSVRNKYLDKDFKQSTLLRQSGFLAQEVEVAAKETGYNFNGLHIPENKNDNYSLAYSQFVVPLVKAVQELSTQNQNLKQTNDEQAKINESLKKDITELRSMVSVLKNNNVKGSIKITETNYEAKLFQNAPNPFRQTTTIRYSIPANIKRAAIIVTTTDGIKIKDFQLNNKVGQTLDISGGQLNAGTYIYTLVVNDVVVDSKKMILTK